MKKKENEYLILVDAQDREMGSVEKMMAHQKGMLHRAISVLLFHSDGRMLIQQRAESKYHCGVCGAMLVAVIPDRGNPPSVLRTGG